MNKPKFNPDQPFDVVKPKFDPSQPFQDAGQADAPEESGILPTIVDKIAQGGSAGLADEASGAMEALGQAAGVQGLGGKIKDIQMSDHGPTMDWEVLKHAYLQARNKDREVLKKESEDHPVISGASELAGAIASPINKLIPTGASGATTGVILGATQGLGNSDADNLADLSRDTLTGGALGGAAGLVGDKIIAPAIGKATNYVGNKLGLAAENLAENATGATGVQASKFRDGAGRELLDRKLVRFGDKASDVAERVSGAVDEANSAIDTALSQLDAKGATASADNIVAELQKQIQDMSKDPSKAGVVRKLQSTIDDIINTGESKIPLSLGEETKRGFRKAAGNWMDPEAGQAGKSAYLAYRDEVEKAAQAADPDLANLFKEGKDTFGLLAPIQEAAEKRASTVKQSPFGGLGDWSAAAAGGVAGGPLGAIASVIGKKVIAPRASSSMAVTFDAISKSLLKSPEMFQLAQKNPAAFQALVHKLESQAGAFENNVIQFPKAADKDQGNGAMNFNDSMGKEALLQKTQGTPYGQVLQNAASKGDQSLSAAHYVLSQRDENYRKVLEGN